MIKVLLGLLVAAVISLLLMQAAEMKASQLRAAALERLQAAQEKEYDELRKKAEAKWEEFEREERSRQKNEREGDHWLPGELDRLRNMTNGLQGAS